MDLSPLADQELGGLIMWVPTGFFWLITLGIVIIRWFEEDSGIEDLVEQTRDQRVGALAAPASPRNVA